MFHYLYSARPYYELSCMKKPSRKLYDLIHSLDRVEKGYFKKQFSGFSKNAQYLVVFNLLNEQSEFNQDQLIQRLPDSIPAKNLPFIKNYLYDAILKSLRNYHEKTTIRSQLRHWLLDIEFLFNKGLYSDCLQLISKAEKQATVSDSHLVLLELSEWRLQIARHTQNHEVLHDRLYQSNREREALFEHYNNIRQYQDIHGELFSYLSTESYASKGHGISELISKRIKSGYFQYELPPKTAISRVYYHYIHITWHKMRKEKDEYYEHATAMFSIFENNPQLKINLPSLYYVACGKHLIASLQTGRFEEFDALYKKLEELRHSLPAQASISMLEVMTSVLLGRYLLSGSFKDGMQHIDHVLETINKHEREFNNPQVTIMRYDIFLLYFLNEDYSNALKFLNQILNDPDQDGRKDIKDLCKIVELILHYEMGHHDLIQYRLKAMRQFVHKNVPANRYEHAVLDFLGQIDPYRTRLNFQKSYDQLVTRINDVRHQPNENYLIQYFDVLKWAECKLKSLPFHAHYVDGRLF